MQLSVYRFDQHYLRVSGYFKSFFATLFFFYVHSALLGMFKIQIFFPKKLHIF